MGDYIIDGAILGDIADAIREKTGGDRPIEPENMALTLRNTESDYKRGYEEGYEDGYQAASEIVDVSGVADNTLEKAYGPTASVVRDYAFYSLSSLKAADFPVATSVGVNSFISCKQLAANNFPAVITIGANAFMSCEKLVEATFPLATKMDSAAFAYCYSLAKLDAGALATIGTRAFWGCSRLATVVLRGQNVCAISHTDVFGGTPIANGTGYVYVPDNLVEQYRAATNWTTYADRIKPLSELEGSA